LAPRCLAFHALLDSLSDEDLRAESRNSPWTNKQILFHMAFGFFLLPSLIVIVLLFGHLPRNFSKVFAALLNLAARPFNVINSLGPRGGSTVFTREGLSKIYDWVLGVIVRLLQLLPEDDVEFARYLVKDVGVAAVPGSSFYRNAAAGRTKLRFCFCKKDETLIEADRRLAKLAVASTARVH
jgi:hypothetical protein